MGEGQELWESDGNCGRGTGTVGEGQELWERDRNCRRGTGKKNKVLISKNCNCEICTCVNALNANCKEILLTVPSPCTTRTLLT